MTGALLRASVPHNAGGRCASVQPMVGVLQRSFELEVECHLGSGPSPVPLSSSLLALPWSMLLREGVRAIA